MHKIRAIVSMVGLIVLGGPALGDVSQHMPGCVGCHGADGVTSMMPDVPIIAGIDAVVQEDALFAYRDGGRKCWPPGIMCQVSAPLSDDDIVELAAHFAALTFKPAAEDFDAALAAEGEKVHEANCGICHGMNGQDNPEASILRGQKSAYLRAVMKEYAAANRDQPPPMEAAIGALTPEQIEALVNYYASYRGAP